MITLHDIFNDLTFGEFSNLKLGDHRFGDPDSEPDPRTYKQLVSHVQIALTALYTEFLLRVEECYVQLHEEIAIYYLDYRWASSNVASAEDPKYINDTVANPFPDNVLLIEEVYDEEGNLLYLNDPEEDLSIFTPRYNAIQVPWPNDFNVVAVQYRADHPDIDYTLDMDPAETYIELPRQLKEALLFYVAARIFAGMSGEKPEGNDYYHKYMAQVEKVHAKGLYVHSNRNDNRFADNGWC